MHHHRRPATGTTGAAKVHRRYGKYRPEGHFRRCPKSHGFSEIGSYRLDFSGHPFAKISEIDFLKTIPDAPHVILTTAFSDYALESYDLNVVDYLLKPFSFERFVKAVNKVPVNTSEKQAHVSGIATKSNPEMLFIKSGYEHLKIQVSEILYIQWEADYTEIFTSDKKYLTSHSLRHWLQTLDDGLFVQIHKSFIVNTANITKVSGNRIYFDPNTHVPIGRAYKEGFVKRYL